MKKYIKLLIRFCGFFVLVSILNETLRFLGGSFINLEWVSIEIEWKLYRMLFVAYIVVIQAFISTILIEETIDRGFDDLRDRIKGFNKLK